MCQDDNLVTRDMEKTEEANGFFASVSTVNTDLQQFQGLETRAKVWSKEDLPSVEDDQVREHLNELDIHKGLHRRQP